MLLKSCEAEAQSMQNISVKLKMKFLVSNT